MYLDDIMVTGTVEEEYLNTLEKVLGLLETSGLCAKKKVSVHGSFSNLTWTPD